MLLTVDLNPRHAARVLEQAARNRALLELEARCRPDNETITAKLIRVEGRLLCIELTRGQNVAPLDLMGAFCEVRLLLAEQLYFFTTCVLDVPDGDPPNRLLVSAPDLVQVANRRRFERTDATAASQVRVYPRGTAAPLVGLIQSISAGGMCCVIPGAGADELLLVGDPVRIQFELAGVAEWFELPAVICTKQLDEPAAQLKLGLEFCADRADPAQANALDRFRTILTEIFGDLGETEGGA